jgi:hypothetical protein
VDPGRSRFPAERLIELAPRVQARGRGYGARVQAHGQREVGDGGSQSPVRPLDLQIGAARVEMVRTGRGWLWQCPRCGKHVLHLYLLDDVCCRRCAGLDYSSRRIGRDMPAAARIAKLREKLGGADPTPFAPLPPRKRWARRLSWLRTLQAIAEQENKLASRLSGMTRDLERRVRVRGMTRLSP